MKTTDNANVVMLNNFITPHHKPIYDALAKKVGHLTILLSTPMEANRNWKPNFGDLDVKVQKNWTITKKLRHAHGFQDDNYIHIPYDTLSQLKALKPDVIISYEMGFRTLLSQFSGWWRNVPLVMVVNVSKHTEDKVLLSRRLLRSLVKRFATVITYNGPSCKRYLEEDLKIDPARLYHVPYATDPAKLYRGDLRREPAQAYDLLYTGQLTDRKGIVPFVKSLMQWCQDNPLRQIRFRLAGTGPEQKNLERLDCPGNLEMNFLGHCGPQQLLELYQSSGLYVFSTLADEWGMVSEEAWVAGLPILGSKFAQSFETYCQEGENGWMFQPTSDEQIYAKIDQAMNTPYHRLEEMRVTCRRTVEYRTPEYAAAKFADAITAALAIKAGSAKS